MPSRLRLPRVPLLVKFSLVAIVPIALLGVVLEHTLQGQIRSRSLSEASGAAALISEVGVQPQLSPLDFTRGMEPARVLALGTSLESGAASSEIERMKIWNSHGVVIYSDNRALMGQSFKPSPELTRALGGKVASSIESGNEDNPDLRPTGQVLSVYVPIRFGADRRPVGAFEIYLPYAPIAKAIARETRTVSLILLIGLGLLYALLFEVVWGASRKIRRQAEVNHYQAFHDALTGLPNRMLFRDRIEHALQNAQRTGTRVAVLMMDLDRFKEVNDALGHVNGDHLLKQIGPRLREALRASDTVARLGGDEFGVLIPDLTQPWLAGDVADRIAASLERPFDVEGLAIDVEPSIGIVLYPDHGTDADSLLQRADVAMYVAKGAHLPWELYEEERDENDAGRLALMADLHRAIAEDELVVHYQPKADLRGGRVRSVEALVRWQHPEHGLIPPDEFIPLAQHTGIIRPLTLHVIDTALGQCREWDNEGISVAVAVNLAMRNLLDSQLPETILRMLHRWELPPDRLVLEITESTIMADPTRALAVLRRLSELGIRLAIDDFGTGYSSLGYLKQLPLDELKIDKSFVISMSSDENDAAIVRSTIDLGRNLGLEVVAEGVETDEIWRRLRGLGCDVAQGYFLSRPQPAADVTVWLRSFADGSAEPGQGAAA